jgi:hypothetical protein
MPLPKISPSPKTKNEQSPLSPQIIEHKKGSPHMALEIQVLA